MMMEVDNPNKNIKVEINCLKDTLKRLNSNINPKENNFLRKHPLKYQNLSKDPDVLNSALSETVPQFATLYHLRLHQVRERIKKQALEKWSGVNYCENILKLKAKNDEQIIIGLFYKDMPLRPSVIKGLENILGANKVSSYVSESDGLYLEDNCGRIKISSTCGFNISEYVTGIIAGLKGYMDEKDTFVIKDIVFYHPEYNKLNINYNFNESNLNTLLNSNNQIIAFISGINIGGKDPEDKNLFSRNLLIDFFHCKLYSNEKLTQMIKRIIRLEICGNLINAPEEIETVIRGTFSKTDINNFVYKAILNTYTEADQYLKILSSCVCVDLIPGLDDISNSTFPQSAINSVLLENSVLTKNLNLVPNPYNFTLDKLNLLITSGQNISSIQRVTNINEPIDVMKKTLEWAHLAPSAPDTLTTFPVKKEDPLVISTLPNVYAVGNQKNFFTKLDHTNAKENITRFICIPEYNRSRSIVLMDIGTLETYELKLDIIFN